MKALSTLVLAVSGAVVAVAAPATESTTMSTMPETQVHAPFPQPQMLDGVEVLNGGASISERRYFESRASEFPLQFIISGRGGEYGVADQLTLRDANGEVVSVPSAGPYVMMQVAPGRYTAEAEFNGAVERRTVTVGSGQTKVNWNTLKASD